jgi:hypothetical protein
MASTVVYESVLAKVEEVSKRGKEGSYTAKVVKFNSKEYTVSKDDKDKVKVGQEYEFKLTKSEYNDKLYYWANLIQKENKQDNQPGNPDEFKKQVFAYLDNLPKEQKVLTIKYLVDRI